MSYKSPCSLKSRLATNIQLTGTKGADRDLLLAVASATFVVKFTRRGTRTVNAGGERGGEAERRQLLFNLGKE